MQEGNLARFKEIRTETESIVSPLSVEDFVVQPIVDISPPKWHLGHTTWFFETFILTKHIKNYRCFDDSFGFIFNSYYEGVGERVLRVNRGNLTRPTVQQVMDYRAYVNEHMEALLSNSNFKKEDQYVLELGLQHEQQHQELLWQDIKYILGHNPLLPAYRKTATDEINENINDSSFTIIESGLYQIGYKGDQFCFDNELGRHQCWLDGFSIGNQLVTNGEFLEFIEDRGYANFKYWLAEGWDWVKQLETKAPLYWHWIDKKWMEYDLEGLQNLKLNQPVKHLSYFEAQAYASWKGMRLPTEVEWEVAASKLDIGDAWEWTQSAYLPYPRFEEANGAIGEYNGKFMVSQMVLRGGSNFSPQNHVRLSYRNFYHPNLRWMMSGLRLIKK